MSDWEIVQPMKVNDNNIRKFAGIENGYVGGKDSENPSVNLASIDKELSNKKLHPVARQALEAEKAKLMTVDTGWEAVTPNSPSAAGSTKPVDSDSGWEPVAKEDSSGQLSTGEMALGMGEAGLEMISALPGAMAGGFNYMATLAGTGGDTDAAMAVKKGTEERINSFAQFKPRTKGGKEMSKYLGEGMDEINKLGGKALVETVNAVPLMGDTLVNETFDREAIDTIGRVVTEGALTVTDPLAAWGGWRAGARASAETNVALKEATSKLEALREQVAPVAEGPAPIEGTVAHADDFAAVNPYDVGGHVSRSDQGRPSVIDEAQGDLFGSEILQDAQPAPRVNPQETLLNDYETVPYDRLSLTDEPFTTPKAELDIPFAEDFYTTEKPATPLLHGTDALHKAKIVQSGKFDSDAGTRKYSYSEFGPDASYFTSDGGWWLDNEKAADGRAASYDSVVRAELDGSANVRRLDNTSDVSKLAKELGYRSRRDLMTDFFTDGLDEGPVAREGIDKAYNPLREKLKAAGIDAIAVDKKFKGKEFFDPAPDQVAVFNKDKVSVIDDAFSTMSQAQKQAHYQRLYQKKLELNNDMLDFQHQKDQGDTSLMRQDHTIMMRNDLRKGDFNTALQRIIDNHPEAAYRNLATYLHSQMDGLKSKMHDEPIIRMGDRDITGYYDPTTHTVGFSGRGGASPHTVLHELTHALTSKFINERPNDIRVTGLKDLYNMLNKDNAMAKQFPGIVNTKEFVAEAFSNPKFQEFLKQTRMNNRSVWGRFMDGVKAIFGLKGDTSIVSAFEHAMDLGKQVVDAQKSTAMAKFKEAGVPTKLMDFMVKPDSSKPVEVIQGQGARDAIRKIPGLENPISDFTFYDKPVAEIIEMARTAVDIPDNVLEKAGQQLQGGALFESLKTRNPVVKYTYERVTRAFQESALAVKRNLLDDHTGLKSYMRTLSPEQKGEIHSAMMLVEGQRELSATDLAAAGFSEAQIAYHNKYREISADFFKKINERRVALGFPAMDQRVAHVAGRFMGDFARMVYKDGKVVGRIAGNTRMELNRATAHIKRLHPDWVFEKIEYNQIGSGRGAKDRFSGMMEAINFIAKADGDVKALLDSYQGYLQTDAVNYLNATRHAKDKVKQAGGIVGSEGHKPWKNMIDNAEEGMKAQLSYFEQGYQWMAMEKAVNDIKKVVGDEQVMAQNPNAVNYANKYLDHAMGRNQGVLAASADWTASALGNLSGFGHTNFFKLSDAVKHRMMQKFMGLGSIPFSVTQLLQPLQTQPALIALLKSRGLEFSAAKAQVKAAQTYLNSMMAEQGAGRMDAFETAATKYADEMGIFDVKMADHTKDINQSPIMEGFDKIADFNITVPEHLTRGTAFFFYSHMLRDAGIPAKDIFGAAENMTNMTMVNYHPIERPMGYAKLGWLGDLASTLTRYKHNQLSQVAFYTREGVRMEQGAKAYAPLATFLTTSLAFGGVMGFYGFQEADAAYELVSEYILKKPDNLTNVVLKSNMPEIISHGVFSTMGVDMTSRFSNANIVPDSIPKALMPHGSAVWDMAESTGRLAMDPFSPTKQKQFAKSWAPMSVQGVIENEMFTVKQPNGMNLYQNPTHGNTVGEGRVERTDKDMGKRAWGFRNIEESKELAQNYATSQIEKGRKELAEKMITKAKYEVMDGSMTPEKYAALVNKAATEYGMDPNTFISQMVAWGQKRQLPQSKQHLLRNANGGYAGAFNIMEQRK